MDDAETLGEGDASQERREGHVGSGRQIPAVGHGPLQRSGSAAEPSPMPVSASSTGSPLGAMPQPARRGVPRRSFPAMSALRERSPESPALVRFTTLAQALTGRSDATPEHGVAWIEQLVRGLATPALRDLGVPRDAFADLAEKSMAASSMKGNPVASTAGELIALLEAAW